MNVLAVIMAALICVCLLVVITLQVTKIFWAWKSKGETLKPRGEEDNKTEEVKDK